MTSFLIPEIEYASWDSVNFNLKVGVVKIVSSILFADDMFVAIEAEAKRQKYNVIYIMLLDGGVINSIQHINNRSDLLYVDKKVTYSKTISSKINQNSQGVKSFGCSSSFLEIYSLAIESGHHSRFKKDGHFPQGTFEKLYRSWIEGSVNKEIADDVIVYEEQNQMKGMLTYKVTQNKGVIGLIAVSLSCQSLGIGSMLLGYLESHLLALGINKLEVVTQGDNIQACRFYEKNKFNIINIVNIYHLWL